MFEGKKAQKRWEEQKENVQRTDLLSPTLHHLSEQGDAVQVDELLGEGDVPGGIGQVLQSLQLSVHAGRLDPFMKRDCSLILERKNGMGGGHTLKVGRHTYCLYRRLLRYLRTFNLQEMWSSAGLNHS